MEYYLVTSRRVTALCSHIFVLLLFLPLLSFSQDRLYNKNYFIACHNCFEKKRAINIEEALSYTTTIELDIWDSRWLSGGWKAMNQDWYVKHNPFTKGNDNCCGGSFSDCLKRIKIWSDNNPNHLPLTIFIDKKENWSNNNETRKPEDLDNLLISIFTEDNIFSPAELKKNEESLRIAASKNQWPTISTIQGKIIFVVTDGTEITSRNIINEYLASKNSNAICFTAPEITNENQITQPNGISSENSTSIVFYNLKYHYKFLVGKLNLLNYVCRLYGAPETIESYNELKKLKVNFIALYNFRMKD